MSRPVLPVPPPSTYDEDSNKGDTIISNTIDVVSEEDGTKIICLPEKVNLNARPYISPYELLSKQPKLNFLIKKKEKQVAKSMVMKFSSTEKPATPIPRFPMILSWHPNVLCIQIDKKLVVKKIQIMNRSKRIIYINYFGLWGEIAAAGAGWWCDPKTRMFIAPGLNGELTVHARPHETSPVPEARIGLQIAVNIKLDTVVGYFVIPVYVKYHNYIDNHYEEIPLCE